MPIRFLRKLGVCFMMSFLICFIAAAQTARSTEDILSQRSSTQSKSKVKKKFSLRKKKSPHLDEDTMMKKYENQLKSNAKKSRWEARMSEKPQYNDPEYFGHKKKPKKRKNGKKKFCKECGLKH